MGGRGGGTNKNKRRCESYISIGFRFRGKYSVLIEPDPSEGEEVKRVGVGHEFYLGPAI